jgi:hypothetical protein
MSPQIYNYKEIEQMTPADSKDMYVYTMAELKQIIYQTYRELGNYNIIKSDCRVFARRVLKALKDQQPLSFESNELVMVSKSTLETLPTDDCLEGFKPSEKLLVGKTFEVTQILWGVTVRKMTELCVFECLRVSLTKNKIKLII